MVNSSLHWPHAYYFLRRRSSTAILVRQSQITRSKLKLPFAYGESLARSCRISFCTTRSTYGWRGTIRTSFERYADDAICHCRSEEEARTLRASLEKRLAQCALTLHPDKTKVVYCKDDDRRGDYPDHKFDFLGYTFRPRLSRRRNGFGVSFSPAVSGKALNSIRQTV